MSRPAIAAAALGLSSALLAGCATTDGDYPRVRYARAVETGGVSAVLAGRPRADDLERAEDRWSRAIADSYACRLDAVAVTEVATVGALELAAMSSASRGVQTPVDGMINYMSAFAFSAAPGRRAPGAERCRRLQSWVYEVQRDGRELALDGAERWLLPPR